METLSINFLIKDSPTAVAILDKDLNFISHSDEWLKQFCPDSPKIVGVKFVDALPAIPSQLLIDLENSLLDKKSVNLGTKFILNNHRTVWLKWRIKAWKTPNDEVGGAIIILEDITEEQREKELLLKAEVVARIGGWEVDLLKNEVYWSAMTRKIHEVSADYKPDLDEGINFYKEGDSREKIMALVNQALSQGKPWDTELIIVTAKKREVWVRTKGEVEFRNGKCVRMFGTFQDIDEKKKAELKYEEIAERLKIATNTANIGIWEYDITSNALLWDANMYKLYGVNKKDFSGEYEAWEAGVHPEDKERGSAEIAQAISGEKDFDTEFRVLWPNGAVRNIRAIARTERDQNGNAIKMIGTNWDITELKRTKLKLELSKASFEETFLNSATGMALVSLDGKWIKVNKRLCESLGYSEQELLSSTFQDITHPDDLKQGLPFLEEVIAGRRESYQLEKRYYHKNGHLSYALVTVNVIRNIDGSISHLISQILDITSRKEAEHELSETAERLKVATQAASIGIWDYRIAENVVICNENMYTMYDIPRDASDLLDAWMKRIHPDDAARVAEELKNTIEEKLPFNSQFRGVRPNGDIVHFVAFGEAQTDKDGKTFKIIGANWDITELRKMRLKLERSQESFNLTFQNSVAGMALVGLDGKWISVNKGICDSFGYTREELLNLTWQEITHPEDLDNDLELLQQVLDEQISTYQLEKRFYHKKGHIIYTLLTVTAARDEDGNLSHLISQLLDITSRIEAEKRLRTLVEVTKAQNDSLLNFAHIVSHNLRSHSTNLSMLTKFLKDEESAEERENLNTMLINATSSLSETIQHLNDVVQVRTGALEKMQSISLLNTVHNIEKSIEGLLKEKSATTKRSIQKSHFVMAVPAYLESIILNLYTNSLKYCSPERKPVITVSSSSKKNYIQIEFKDNGQGIDLERHGNKVFGMYKTFHAHKEAKGIGLFITKNQIESMNGKIWLESKVDKGTTFFIKLKKG